MIKNIIIGVETIIIIILLVIVINNRNTLGTNNNTNNENTINENKKYIGIYYNAEKKHTFRIEDEDTCMFISEYKSCSYTIENDVIKIKQNWYYAGYNNGESDIQSYKTLEECKNDIKNNEMYKKYPTPVDCYENEYTKASYEGRVVNNGFLIGNLLYTKIN